MIPQIPLKIFFSFHVLYFSTNSNSFINDTTLPIPMLHKNELKLFSPVQQRSIFKELTWISLVSTISDAAGFGFLPELRLRLRDEVFFLEADLLRPRDLDRAGDLVD